MLPAIVVILTLIGPAQASGYDTLRRVPVHIVAASTILDSGGMRYSYEVTNGSTVPLTAISIGYAPRHVGENQLTILPIGATVDSIPPSSYACPDGWDILVQSTEDQPKVYIEWERTDPAREIQGGCTLGGFSINVPQADSLYETGWWTAWMSDGSTYEGALQRSESTSSSPLLGTAAPGSPKETDWARAERSILRLPPTAFPRLPGKIQIWLSDRGFTIPQTVHALDDPHNVISGAFEQHGSLDWACLASRGDSSAIIVFFSSSLVKPIEMEWARDRQYLQAFGPDSIGYSRSISRADSATIRDGFARDGLQPPVPVTHDGIEDGFIAKGSVIQYYDRGVWLTMGGSD